ncbi:MAG: DUF4097 family beta strand repeat protein [Bryobacteraceae bacterium]|nr:DUF4097 family beta strand repeat protein [Bryobacteraceae bacterium]
MRRGSLVAPLVLILLGVLFLLNNVQPELSLIGIAAQYWPFLLIAWGGLRLVEILLWSAQGKALPVSGISGGEWTFIVFLSIFGSGAHVATHRERWPGFNVRLRGLEVLGDVYDYPIEEKVVSTSGGSQIRVVLESLRGNARITGADVSEVRVTGRKTIRAMDKSDADRAAEGLVWEVVREGSTVLIRPKGNLPTDNDLTVSTDLDITVPAQSRVEARGRRGDFDISDIRGDVDIDSDNAGVRLQNISGNARIELRASDIVRAIGVTGNVEIKGSGHDIELENIEGQATVSGSYVGELQFRAIAKPVRFEGGSKKYLTELQVEACPGQIRMNRGNLSMENVTGPVTVEAKSKDVQISGFSNGLDLRVDRGDLEIHAGNISLPRINAVTKSGNIELTIPENAQFSLKGSVDKGEIENDYGSMLSVRDGDRGGTLTGAIGGGPELIVHTNRGVLRLRKGGSAEIAEPIPPTPPRPTASRVPARAAEIVRPIPVERN